MLEGSENENLASAPEPTPEVIGDRGKSIGQRLASLGPTVYNLLAGILLSLGANLLTQSLSEWFSERYLTPFVKIGTVSGLGLIGAAVLCYKLVLQYEWIRDQAEKEAVGFPIYPLARDQAEKRLRETHFDVRKAYWMIGLVVVSLMIWVIGIVVTGGVSTTPPVTPTPFTTPSPPAITPTPTP